MCSQSTITVCVSDITETSQCHLNHLDAQRVAPSTNVSCLLRICTRHVQDADHHVTEMHSLMPVLFTNYLKSLDSRKHRVSVATSGTPSGPASDLIFRLCLHLWNIHRLLQLPSVHLWLSIRLLTQLFS